MENGGNCIVSRLVGTIRKLKGVQWEGGWESVEQAGSYKHVGTAGWLKEVLKMCVRASLNSSADFQHTTTELAKDFLVLAGGRYQICSFTMEWSLVCKFGVLAFCSLLRRF